MDSILEFAQTLAGIYDNFAQSQQNPKDFARINIIFRPLPWGIFDGPGFYSEQHYDYAPWSPYRQGVHKLIAHKENSNTFIMENFGYAEPMRLAGAGRNPELLASLKKENLKARCGCAMHFKTKKNREYIGSVEPGKKCMIPRDGQLTYLVSEVEVTQESWTSRDRGYDPDTNKQIWGSEHGQLIFKKVEDIGETISNDWIIEKRSHER
tara:strand:+ start:1934 stop:2560 length:627 start_codon:yes stop_codon:yes gene_type:complete